MAERQNWYFRLRLKPYRTRSPVVIAVRPGALPSSRLLGGVAAHAIEEGGVAEAPEGHATALDAEGCRLGERDVHPEQHLVAEQPGAELGLIARGRRREVLLDDAQVVLAVGGEVLGHRGDQVGVAVPHPQQVVVDAGEPTPAPTPT